MRVIIHDLRADQWIETGYQAKGEDIVISDNGDNHFCVGCFGCWFKTPGRCVIKDSYQKMGEYLSMADELIIISKCSFGSYSSFVKNVLDRSISYVSPYFEVRAGEMHHQARYDNEIQFTAIFYGDDITEGEKETASNLVKANALNLNGKIGKVSFVDSPAAVGGII